MRYRTERALRALMGVLLYFPAREIWQTPDAAGLASEDLEVLTGDGERVHGWTARSERPTLGHILLFHGNEGNIADRVEHVALLARTGFEVCLFDYRGYGRSSGKPSEQGTYEDGRAVVRALAARGWDPGRLCYLGESLGAAIALKLALESPPRGLILQSAFTSLRDVARRHYPFVPSSAVPDAYPSLRLVAQLRVPLLIIHGDRDTVVPVAQGRALFDAAPEAKRLEIFPGLGHNDLLVAGERYARVVVDWVGTLAGSAPS